MVDLLCDTQCNLFKLVSEKTGLDLQGFALDRPKKTGDNSVGVCGNSDEFKVSLYKTTDGAGVLRFMDDLGLKKQGFRRRLEAVAKSGSPCVQIVDVTCKSKDVCSIDVSITCWNMGINKSIETDASFAESVRRYAAEIFQCKEDQK